MTDDDNQHTVALADLSATKVREENPQVADALSAKEERIESLNDEVADLKAEVRSKEDDVEELAAWKEDKEDEDASLEEAEREEYEDQIEELESELEASNQIIEQIESAKRDELENRFATAYATVKNVPAEEAPLDAHEEASNDQFRHTVEAFEDAAESMSASASTASSEEEDLGGTAVQATEEDVEDRKRQMAADMGILDQLEKADELAPQGFEVTGDGVGN
jgi:seryl-tRNA synthetase